MAKGKEVELARTFSVGSRGRFLVVSRDGEYQKGSLVPFLGLLRRNHPRAWGGIEKTHKTTACAYLILFVPKSSRTPCHLSPKWPDHFKLEPFLSCLFFTRLTDLATHCGPTLPPVRRPGFLGSSLAGGGYTSLAEGCALPAAGFRLQREGCGK